MRRNSRRVAWAGFGVVGVLLLMSSAAFACQTFRGRHTWTTNAATNNTVTVVGGNNVEGGQHDLCNWPYGTALPTIKAPTGNRALRITLQTQAETTSCLNNLGENIFHSKSNFTPVGSGYELYQWSSNNLPGIDGFTTGSGQPDACHTTGSRRIGSANVFDVDPVTHAGSYTWTNATLANSTGYTMICVADQVELYLSDAIAINLNPNV